MTVVDQMTKYAALIAAPFYMMREAIKAKQAANNLVKAFDGVNSEYNFSTLPSYKVDDIKKVCKTLNCSINDFLMAIFTTSL